MNFVDRLREIQKEKSYTDLEMAQLIGCSRQLYQMTRTNKVGLGAKILKGAVSVFPQLVGDAYIFLTGNEDIVSKGVDNVPEPPETHQNEHRGEFIRKLIAKVKQFFHTDISIGGE